MGNIGLGNMIWWAVNKHSDMTPNVSVGLGCYMTERPEQWYWKWSLCRRVCFGESTRGEEASVKGETSEPSGSGQPAGAQQLPSARTEHHTRTEHHQGSSALMGGRRSWVEALGPTCVPLHILAPTPAPRWEPSPPETQISANEQIDSVSSLHLIPLSLGDIWTLKAATQIC